MGVCKVFFRESFACRARLAATLSGFAARHARFAAALARRFWALGSRPRTSHCFNRRRDVAARSDPPANVFARWKRPRANSDSSALYFERDWRVQRSSLAAAFMVVHDPPHSPPRTTNASATHLLPMLCRCLGRSLSYWTSHLMSFFRVAPAASKPSSNCSPGSRQSFSASTCEGKSGVVDSTKAPFSKTMPL